MLKKLEEIKYRLFPLKYSTLREYFFWVMIAPFLGMWISVILLKGEILFKNLDACVGFFFVNLWAFYNGSYKPRQWLFKKKGKRYEGKIIKAERIYSVGNCTYYFFIEFKKGKKTLIRRTAGYRGNPFLYLENNRCGVYELMGKFMEADFNVRKKFPKESVEMTDDLYFPIDKHKMFMPKGKKYV